MKTLMTAALGTALIFSPFVAGAQEEGTADGGQPNVAQLIEDVNAIAANLQENVSGMQEAIENSVNSREEGAKLLEQMQALIEAVHGSLAEDSDIWTELTWAMEIWDENRQMALDKSETNPAFDEIAKEWGIKIEEAGELRKQILAQRAESMALLDQISSDREVVLAYYDLGQADRALDAMRQVSSDLGRMNESMRAIVDQTHVVAGPAVSQ